MSDPRYDQLAKYLVEYSIHLKAGERVLIDAFDASDEAVIALIRAVRSKEGVPFVQLHRAKIARELALGVSQSQLDVCRAVALVRMKKMQAYVALRGGHNMTELIDVPEANMALTAEMMRPVLDCRINKTKWVVL